LESKAYAGERTMKPKLNVMLLLAAFAGYMWWNSVEQKQKRLKNTSATEKAMAGRFG